MSKQRSFLPRFSGDSNVVPLIPARTGNRRTAGLALALVLLATAGGMAVDSADSRGGPVPQAGGDAAVDSGFVYFPAQHENQATEPVEHIEAF